ncbi:MAG: beta-lactamase family protein [Deltaproteobacteria bacterium]|nr:beta-lactamase family protein [Deltaproteobacteria bacterium]
MGTIPAIEGKCDARFAAIREAFATNFEENDEYGAAVTLIKDGHTVVDLWGGHVDPQRCSPWQRDTLADVFSVGKAFTTLCALVLVDRGLIDLDAPVARYWPEFATAGKEAITVRQLLCHQAGLPAIRRQLADDAMFDWQVMTEALAAQEPWWTPGTRHGYHVNTFGFLVGEVVRRASAGTARGARTLGTFLRDEITGPLGADVYIGVAPGDEARVAEFVWLPDLGIPDFGIEQMSDEQLMRFNTYFNPRGFSGHDVVNTSPWRRAEIPSANAHATARGVARVYAALCAGGTIDGIEIVGRSVLQEATTEHVNGLDAVLDRPSRFGLGFQIPTPERPIGSNPGVFGHFGAGGSVGFADPVAGVAFGYVMNRMGPRWHNPTNRRLIDALYSCL